MINQAAMISKALTDQYNRTLVVAQLHFVLVIIVIKQSAIKFEILKFHNLTDSLSVSVCVTVKPSQAASPFKNRNI